MPTHSSPSHATESIRDDDVAKDEYELALEQDVEDETLLEDPRHAHPSPHFADDISPPNSPLLTSISANRCISGSSRCSGMFGISS
jgi:hypothetical protein